MAKDIKPAVTRKLRPSERVRDFLQAQVRLGKVSPGDRLPTTQELAQDLSVSSATVKNVFQQLSREGLVRTMVGNGSFWIGGMEPRHRRLVIGINYVAAQHAEPKSIENNWTYRIYGGLTKVSLESEIPIALRPFGVTPAGSLEEQEKIEHDLKQLDGIFLLFPHNQRLRRITAQGGRPLVSLNPVSEMDTADFVSPDYHGSARLIGRAWRECCRRSILAVIAPLQDKSVSIRLRLSGLLSGIGFGRDPDVQFTLLELTEGSEALAYREIGKRLADGLRPDAVFCAGDAQAVGACQALKEAGIAVPGDCSVVGGNGLIAHTSGGRALTRTMQPLERLGEEGILLLLQRIEQNGRSLPGKYLQCPIFPGETTRSEENSRIAALALEDAG